MRSGTTADFLTTLFSAQLGLGAFLGLALLALTRKVVNLGRYMTQTTIGATANGHLDEVVVNIPIDLCFFRKLESLAGMDIAFDRIILWCPIVVPPEKISKKNTSTVRDRNEN